MLEFSRQSPFSRICELCVLILEPTMIGPNLGFIELVRSSTQFSVGRSVAHFSFSEQYAIPFPIAYVSHWVNQERQGG